jgi:nucleotide-binding universal stress UspA family protein
MSSKKDMLTRFLLPLDNLESFKGTAALMGSMAKVLEDRLEKLTLLRVMEGSYIAQHMENIDVRVEHVLSSDLLHKLRKEHISNTIEPEMEKARSLLTKSGVVSPVDIVIQDGTPADVIADMANEQNYSTIIMQRRELTTVEEMFMFMGSVTYRLLHRDLHATIYLTGTDAESRDYNSANILIALDGSEHAKAALEEAAVLLGKCSNLKQVVLVSVTDVASYREVLGGGEATPEKESLAVLDDAASMLDKSGVPNDKIVKVARYGKYAASVIEEEVTNRNIDTVFMGRRGRSAIAELFIGSVSKKIIDACPAQTIALVTAD